MYIESVRLFCFSYKHRNVRMSLSLCPIYTECREQEFWYFQRTISLLSQTWNQSQIKVSLLWFEIKNLFGFIFISLFCIIWYFQNLIYLHQVLELNLKNKNKMYILLHHHIIIKMALPPAGQGESLLQQTQTNNSCFSFFISIKR